jgi:hypothetical protein
LFPRLDEIPAIVVIKEKNILSGDFSSNQSASYLFSVQIFGNPEDGRDFEGYDEDFQRRGLNPELNYEYDSIQSFHIQSREQKIHLPWIYVISSRWLSVLPAEIYPVLIANLRNILMQRNRIIINYHPENLLVLNKVFKFIPGTTPFWFYDAETVDDVLEVIDATFDTLIMRPMNELLLE